MLSAIAIVIVGISFWYTNEVVKKIAVEERKKVKLWADAIEKKALLVKNTEVLFEKIKQDERQKMEIWAMATRKLIQANINEDLTFYSEIIAGNENIPVILINENNKVIASKNLEIDMDTIKYFDGTIKEIFSQYEPIVVSYGRHKNYLYYQDSKVFKLMRETLNNIIESFLSEVVINSASVPVIITDSTQNNIITFGNLDTAKVKNEGFLLATLQKMKEQNDPIIVEITSRENRYIYYQDSLLLTQLQYFPMVQFGVIALFIFVAYLLFSTFRKAEQNKVWLGMAKETAHQLGTPLSSLMAWTDILRTKGVEEEILTEIQKDIFRLNTVTQRFSNIGSQPLLKSENLKVVVEETIAYMRIRTSKKIQFIFTWHNDSLFLPINRHLFEWVLENLYKNAVDAIAGKGEIITELSDDANNVIIDISDSGKGLSKRQFKSIFNPGYTTKLRGWGLGLSLSKRIVENYHSGKIFVKQSIVSKGTTIRIVLKKKIK